MSTVFEKYKCSFFPRMIVHWDNLIDKVILTKDMERFKATFANRVLIF